MLLVSLIRIHHCIFSKLYFSFTLSVLPANAILTYNGNDVTNQRIEVRQGSYITISCRGGSNPTWKKGSESITTSSYYADVYQRKSSTSTLIIRSLTSAHVGVYTCHFLKYSVPTVETLILSEFHTKIICYSAS